MRSRLAGSGWRGVVLVAVVYIYFLIFAQFAFLARLAECGTAGNSLKLVMAAMAAGGILLSLAASRIWFPHEPATVLRGGLAISAVAALVTLLPLNLPAAVVVAFLIGAGLGISTVTLVTHLRRWTGERRGILNVGLGTGIAYLVCNLPAVFTATPRMQAALSAGLCAVACALPLKQFVIEVKVEAPSPRPRWQMPFAVALASFAALIWLDSAAFYIIQQNASLKAGTWLGNAHLWTNGALHFAAALGAAALLQRGRTAITLALAFTALGSACVLLHSPSLILSASLFYPVGVSLYSVALVAYPSFLTTAEHTENRARQAGWLYAVAGWMGSAMGIGMGQNLGHVPLAFVAVAGAVVAAPLCFWCVRNRPRELILVAAVAAAAFPIATAVRTPVRVDSLTPARRGRTVYISEGCISCHSQYVRPGTGDALMWGPVESLTDIHAQKPPLIGNRRQGPDLSQVGSRRSPLWLKAHLVNPAEVSYRSPMPSFAFLFRDGRGDDLVAYLGALRGPGEQQQLERQAKWQTEWQQRASEWANAGGQEGEYVYLDHCATCHDLNGATRVHWMTEWRKAPPDRRQLRALANKEPLEKLARVAKFGAPGTDMPGHEYLKDSQIIAVTTWLKNSTDDSQFSTR